LPRLKKEHLPTPHDKAGPRGDAVAWEKVGSPEFNDYLPFGREQAQGGNQGEKKHRANC